MSTDPKSLAAEIEAVTCSLTCAEQYLIEADFGAAAAAVREASRLLEAQAAEIAALQSRAFEDGARWMRERAIAAIDMHDRERREWVNGSLWHILTGETSKRVAALPLQPEGERNA
ncbi:hypothetical protein LPC10_01950 [Methylorubrum sp. B1-46]|uniref:hypothetical protein n=1 Tax=Methylorubrum sp. B1-46 TaxID=2897334 RepID=UPI001E44FB9D|nr:hypothetical protein [Methylorubrum sp. B1-46]UGB26404.1 hypothetical protein LPC10_01950 [Methylorubrum sp. B1-46]